MKQGWEIKEFDDCLEKVVYTNKIQRKDFLEVGDYPIISQEQDFINGYWDNSDDLFKVKKPIVIFGDHTQVLKYVDFDFVLGADGVKILQPKNSIDPRFFYYFLQNMNLGSLGYARHYRLLKEIEVSYPKSLPEQQRIVSILDEAFAAIAKAKANAEQNLQNAKELFESYLQSVFEKKGDGWISSTIGETCKLMTGGTPSTTKKEYYDGGNIKWLVSGDINQKEIFDCEGRITELGLENSNARYIPVNSVLIALNGQGKTRGTVAMLRTEATCNQSLVSIYPNDVNKVLPELIYANLDGRYNEIRKLTGDSGNDRRGLNMPIIRNISFSYPKSLAEQQTIVRQLDALRAETQKLEAVYRKKIVDLEELKKSVLQKAFNGEL